MMFSVRVSDDLAQRFDAAAVLVGGRSALLRRLITTAADLVPRPGDPPRGPRNAARVMVRLAAADVAALDVEAAGRGLSRAGWVAALVRRRVHDRPGFGRTDELALIAIQAELRRIAVNIHQIARALNSAVLEDRSPELALTSFDDLRAEIREHLRGLRQALEGNLAYWEIDP
jgi:hypothetical protein